MTGETTEQDPIRATYQQAQRRTRELYAQRLGFQPPAAPVDPPAVESLTPGASPLEPEPRTVDDLIRSGPEDRGTVRP